VRERARVIREGGGENEDNEAPYTFRESSAASSLAAESFESLSACRSDDITDADDDHRNARDNFFLRIGAKQKKTKRFFLPLEKKKSKVSKCMSNDHVYI
jgi:hypothetical protein